MVPGLRQGRFRHSRSPVDPDMWLADRRPQLCTEIRQICTSSTGHQQCPHGRSAKPEGGGIAWVTP